MDKNWEKIPKVLDKVWIGVSGERKVKGFSYWIQKYQKTNYSHAFAMYWSRDSKGFIITNCHGVSVQLDRPDQFNETSLIRRLWSVDVDTAQRGSFINTMIGMDGNPYSSSSQLIWLVISKYIKFKWFPFKDGNDSFWCSEYADEMLKSVGVNPSYKILDMSRNQVTPLDNVKALELLNSKHPRVNEVRF